MITVEPIDQTQRDEVQVCTLEFIERASELFTCRIDPVEIVFDLSGRAAGMYRVHHKGYRKGHRTDRCIRYNPYIFARYYEDSLKNTVPHEVAHYVTDILFGLKSIKPHGKEWRSVMSAFGVHPSVTGDYNLDGIPQRRQRRFQYQCSCRNHDLTTCRHNKVIADRAQYFCRSCKSELVHVIQ